MAKFFSADIHRGEIPAPGNPSYYRRAIPQSLFERIFITQCQNLIGRADDLYLVGDLICELDDLEFYNRLPDCNLHIICGNKEEKIEHFAEKAEEILAPHRGDLEILTGVQYVEINGRYWRVAHKPEALCGFATPMPSICGHVHYNWRTTKLPDGQPLVNVGVDVWSYGLATEEYLQLQYDGVISGAFDRFIGIYNANGRKKLEKE